jgi:hypothetical protein
MAGSSVCTGEAPICDETIRIERKISTPAGSSTVHIYTQTTHRTTQLTTYRTTQTTTNLERVPAVPRLCELYPGICLILTYLLTYLLTYSMQHSPS